MKQTIHRFNDDKIKSKYYKNGKGKLHSLFITYWHNGNIMLKTNYNNGKLYGLNTGYHHIESGKIDEQKYYL